MNHSVKLGKEITVKKKDEEALERMLENEL